MIEGTELGIRKEVKPQSVQHFNMSTFDVPG